MTTHLKTLCLKNAKRSHKTILIYLFNCDYMLLKTSQIKSC